jgi:hypothetical protein
MRLKNKIVLGTMKLKKYFKNTRDLSEFLNYSQNKGIKQFHVSYEYPSYKLIVQSLKKIKTKKFTFIIKLSEPASDKIKFSLKKFIKKLNKYRKDLGFKHNYIVQLVNRYKCNDPKKYLFYEQKTLDDIQGTVVRLKKNKIIKSFYFFPYHKNTNKIKKRLFIDGITCYRHQKEKKNDAYAKRNNFKIIAIRVFGDSKKLSKNNLKKLIMYNFKNKLVEKIIVGLNNKNQLKEFLLRC